MNDRITPKELAQLKTSGERFGSLRNDDGLRLVREVSQLNIELIRAREEVSLLTEERDRQALMTSELDKDVQTLRIENEKLRAALLDVKHDWDHGAFLTRTTLSKVSAALGDE